MSPPSHPTVMMKMMMMMATTPPALPTAPRELCVGKPDITIDPPAPDHSGPSTGVSHAPIQLEPTIEVLNNGQVESPETTGLEASATDKIDQKTGVRYDADQTTGVEDKAATATSAIYDIEQPLE
mmetsp:Transcript_13154/g.17313  ORF Transcript_13154/g.17313 Transcript_13154/m.17313 type:complete len:125 (-) Transcript_13154:656-1030(-)